MPTAVDPASFITRWAASGGSERANYAVFLSELCDILGVPRPEPTQADPTKNVYVFERDVVFHNTDGTTNTGRIDLYKRGCFILEAKQGTEQAAEEPVLSSTPKKLKKGHGVRGTKGWDDAMTRARGQAESYAKALPVDEGWPAFLIVVDVGHSLELFADFSKSGKTYLPFPDPKTYRLMLADLAEEGIRDRLRAVWTDPLSLDPTRRAAKVTRELADRLAKLAKSLEASKVEPGRVAQFLMRCLFTMFAEDVDLIPQTSFTELLKSIRHDVTLFPDTVRDLWESMDRGKFCGVLKKKLRRFNGGLFEDCEALPLTLDQLDLLIEASKAEWRDVEPAIFGTLLERALDPHERHKLGAHYTPRAYVERLVMPTIIEPLREQWDAVRAAAITEANRGNNEAAIETVREFLDQLAHTRVLDPACGSGNFLYVALEHMKRLEGEVLNTLRDLGDKRLTLLMELTVNPSQFKGIEVNPRAAAIADLVLWIGYLQWHTRTRRLDDIAEPIIQNFHNIECRDAVLTWDSVEAVRDEQGQPVTRWDGRTQKPHPVTGELVPDDTARVPVLKYLNPRKADWPEADYIVGNPPFIGNKRMRFALGDGYVDALRDTYAAEIPKTTDYVMYWWDIAARKLVSANARQFGFISTNSITQVFNRCVIESHVSASPRVVLRFAIPDHPWVDSDDGAAVRIAMTVGTNEEVTGTYQQVVREDETDNAEIFVETSTNRSHIFSDLTIGTDITTLSTLRANQLLASQGVNPLGLGFRIDRTAISSWKLNIDSLPRVVRPYLIGRDLVQSPEEKFVIDFTGYSEVAARDTYPALYQHLFVNVKPERDLNRRDVRRINWWLFGENAPMFRAASVGLSRYVATCRTARHRIFCFVSADALPDAKIVAIALNDAFYIGVLSSQVHIGFSTRTGAWLGIGNDSNYNHSDCFGKFPFPAPPPACRERISSLAERLDAHRKKQQALHPELTLTGMYNVLEKLRSGEPLTAKEKVIHEQGLVSVLKQIHDDLDAAVFEAYGWPTTLTDEEILERLVALNAERAAEEQRGLIRWLRPEFQNPSGGKTIQPELDIEPEEEEVAATGKKSKRGAKPQAGKGAEKKTVWPKKLAEQAHAVSQRLQTAGQPLTAADLAKAFTKAKETDIAELLETLVTLGKARPVKGDRYAAV